MSIMIYLTSDELALAKEATELLLSKYNNNLREATQYASKYKIINTLKGIHNLQTVLTEAK